MASGTTVHERATLLRDFVFAANDGVITTFAIVAGVAGASLSSKVVLILGFANLFADGLSMASGNYLGVKSEAEYQKVQSKKLSKESSPFRHGAVTLVSFVSVGVLPLIPYTLPYPSKFQASAWIVCLSLFTIGGLRSLFTKKNWALQGLEMLIIGGIAASVAYVVGFLLNKYVVV